MSDESKSPPESAERRRRAETRLKDRGASAAEAMSESELRRLHHELEVHQVELETQNEELLQARARVEELLERYTDLYDFAPVGYFTLGRDGAILQSNLAGAVMLGVERSRLAGRRLGSFVPAGSRPAWERALEAAFTGIDRQVLEADLEPEGGPTRYVRVEAVAEAGGRQCRAAVVDITERRRVEIEREGLIRELQASIQTVNQLSGILPICAGCKDIRNEAGAWVQLEAYIRDHSEAQFSHGFCPNCAKKWRKL